jgi:hypothetical protein
MDEIVKFGAVAGGIASGGGFLIWFGKLMASRLIKQYDDKHAEHEKRLRDLSELFAEQLTDLKVKLAKLEPVVTMAMTLREDMKSVEGDVAIIQHQLDKEVMPDIDEAHNQLRAINKKFAS